MFFKVPSTQPKVVVAVFIHNERALEHLQCFEHFIESLGFSFVKLKTVNYGELSLFDF